MQQYFFKKRTRVICMILLNILVMLVCAFLLVPQIDSNDDMVLHTYTSRAYGEPTRYSGYTGIVLAELLYHLQAALPQYNCLVLVEFLLIMLSFCALSSVVVCRCQNALGVALGCALAVLFAPQFYNWIHYTKNAMLLTTAGLILVFYALSEQRIKAVPAVLGALLAFMGAQLRMTSFLAGCAFAFVIGVYTVTDFSGITSIGAWFKRYKKHLIVFSAVLVLVFGMDIAKTAVYDKDGAAAEFWEYCETRASLSDYELPNYLTHANEYQALGLTPNDLVLIETWSFGDLEYFDTETLQAIIDMREPQSFLRTLKLFASDAPSVLVHKPLFWVSMALLVLCLVFCKKREMLLAIALLVCFVGCFIYQYHIGRTTRWVQDGIIICFAAGLAYCVGGELRFGKRVWKAAGAAATVAALLLSFASYHTEYWDYNTYFSLSRYEIYSELNADGGSLYLADIDALPVPMYQTFSSAPDDIYKNVYVLGGWDTGAAHKNSVLERYGVVGSPYRALVEKDNVYLIDKNNYESKAKFIEEHIDPAARYALVDIIGERDLYVFAFATNFPDAAYLQTDEIAVTGAAAVPYKENYSFLTVTADFAYGGQISGACYFDIITPHGGHATYRATVSRDGQLCAELPMVDFYVSGDYELRVVFATEGGCLISAQPTVIEFVK